RAIITPEPD
ncbi:hypothetical protein L195_g057302, partial [Trifolium pratense]